MDNIIPSDEILEKKACSTDFYIEHLEPSSLFPENNFFTSRYRRSNNKVLSQSLQFLRIKQRLMRLNYRRLTAHHKAREPLPKEIILQILHATFAHFNRA